jgi:hypothetical protein
VFARARFRIGLVTLTLALLLLVMASGAAAALPRTYTVQTVQNPEFAIAPANAIQGRFGVAFINAGDLNGDGKDDLLVGTDEHGGPFAGTVYEISGADGSPIRRLSPPDGGGSGNGAAWGGYVGRLGMTSGSAPFSDLGSCPGGSASQTCPNGTIGAPDGIPELLVTALGVDVPFDTTGLTCEEAAAQNLTGTLVDAGRAYVVDGATGAVLKRLEMPPCDLAQQSLRGPVKPAFGRTVLTPAGLPPCAGNMGIGSCAAYPYAVRAGDRNGGNGAASCSAGGNCPDIVVSASDYFETGATANPQSDCASSAANQCLQAGRSYIFDGESIAGTDPAVPDDSPTVEIKNPAAQADELGATTNHNRENLGYSIEPVGDLGKCSLTNAGSEPPGAFCRKSNGMPDSTTAPDGVPDVVISSHRTDDFGMWDAGVALLFDGASGTLLATYRHPEPQPAALFGFSNYNQPAIGDVGSGTNPDSYQAAMRQNNPYTGGGRGYVMNGNFLQGGSPNGISFASFADPTPNPSEDFGTSSGGVGNVAGAETSPALDSRNEVMIGAYGPHNPGTDTYIVNDVHLFSPITEQELQRFESPDQQPGAGFGNALAPLGDLNGDGFLDYAIGASLYNEPGAAAAGRIYIFRSDNSPAPTTGAPAAVSLAGRAVELNAAPDAVLPGRKATLTGRVDAFANQAACQPGQDVELQERPRSSPDYTTLTHVTSDASGHFSFTIAPGATRFYRAILAQSDVCLGTASDRASVVVVQPVRVSRARLHLRRTGYIRVRISCPSNSDGRCTGVLTLKTTRAISTGRGRAKVLKLGEEAFRVPVGRAAVVKVLVPKGFRPILRRLHRVRVRATATNRDRSGVEATSRATVTLTA